MPAPRLSSHYRRYCAPCCPTEANRRAAPGVTHVATSVTRTLADVAQHSESRNRRLEPIGTTATSLFRGPDSSMRPEKSAPQTLGEPADLIRMATGSSAPSVEASNEPCRGARPRTTCATSLQSSGQLRGQAWPRSLLFPSAVESPYTVPHRDAARLFRGALRRSTAAVSIVPLVGLNRPGARTGPTLD